VRLDRERLLDMIEMCDLLLSHASDPKRLAHDPVVQAAAQRWIEILGEAASKVSDSLKAAHPEIAWREIVGTRVILAHAYFQIDPAIVERVIREEIPLLRERLTTLLAALTDV
jgi:uncharacterized protein with HEPN domain